MVAGEWTMLELLRKQKVEEKLAQQGISRYDLGREKNLLIKCGNGKKNMLLTFVNSGQKNGPFFRLQP